MAREHKMTKWDVGQVLIKASDCLFECAVELRATNPEFADLLFRQGCEIGDVFNAFGSHSFGLRDSSALKKVEPNQERTDE
jgi:hypothetical protein